MSKDSELDRLIAKCRITDIKIKELREAEIQSLRTRNAELEAENGRLREAGHWVCDAWEAWSTCVAPEEAINRYHGEFIENIEELKQAPSPKAGDRQLCEDQNGHECTVRETVCAVSGGNICCLVCGKRCEDACEYVFCPDLIKAKPKSIKHFTCIQKDKFTKMQAVVEAAKEAYDFLEIRALAPDITDKLEEALADLEGGGGE